MSYTNTVSYIDTTYYTSAYKPNIQASIQDKYLNGPKNAANFNAYAERATEAVNRLTNNTIEGVIGGFDLLPTTPQALVQKATAALVEYWFLQGYNLGQINSQISNSIVKGKTVKTSEKMREFIPETVLWLLQTSGLTDQTFLGAESDRDLMNNVIPGFTINDFFTKAEQLALFQEKGDYDNNFHKDIVIQGELTDTAAPRYFLIGKSQPGQKNMVFSFIGGNKLDVAGAKQIVSITKETGGNALDYTESSVITLNPKLTDVVEEPEVFAGINTNDEIEVYIETKADKDLADILITDITPDDNAQYELFSSTLNAPTDAFQLGKYSVVQSAGVTNGLQAQIDGVKNVSDKNTNDITILNSINFATQANLDPIKADIVTNTNGIATNKADIATITGTTIPNVINSKIDITEANDRFIHKDPQVGTNEATMAGTYTPINAQDVMTKGLHDSNVANLQSQVDDNKTEADVSAATLRTLEPEVNTNKINIQTNTAGIATNKAAIAANTVVGTNNTTDVATLEGATDTIRVRLDALEKEGQSGKRIFDTGENNQPKAHSQIFELANVPSLADGTLVDMKAIPADAINDNIQFVATDFANGETLQIVVWGDESDPTPGFDEPESAWTGTQSFTQLKAGGVATHISTSHWSADFKLSTTGVITVTNFAASTGGPGNQPWDIKRLLLVQATLDLAQTTGATLPYYSKTESDNKYTTIATTAALDVRVVAQKGMIDALEPRIDTNVAAIAANKAEVAINTKDIATNKTSIATKQDSAIAGATTTAKTVLGAINELDATGKANKGTIATNTSNINMHKLEIADNAQDIADFGDKNVSGDRTLSDLVTTSPGLPTAKEHILATEEYVDANSGGTSWTDITSSYQTRVWTDADVGKRVKIHNRMGAIVVATLNKVYDVGKNAVAYAAQGWTNTPNSSAPTALSVMWFEGTNLYGDTIVPPSRLITKFEIEGK